MNIDIGLMAKARFKCVAHKGDENNPTKETGWFDNIVLDSGLARMKVGVWEGGVSVGTGNSTPIVSQTGLDVFRARTTTLQVSRSWNKGIDDNNVEYYAIKGTYRFASGAASGNISEVGLSWDTGNSLWNRALIRNSSGQATVINVLSDEYLDVSFEVRIYRKEETVGTIQVKDGVGDVVSTHTYTTKPFSSNSVSVHGSGQVKVGYVLPYSGTWSGGTEVPTGALPNPLSTIGTVVENSNPTQQTTNFSFELGVGTGSWKSIGFGLEGLMLSFDNQVVFFGYMAVLDTPIVKSATERVIVRVTTSWGRYTGV